MTWLRARIEDGLWFWFVLRRRSRQKWGAVTRFVVKPPLPKSADGKVRLHLGCGDIAAAGFINVDLRRAPHIHHVRDVTDLSVFADDSVDLVYASHVLEHVSHRALRQTLWEWRRVLKPGGVLRLSVPDFDKMIGIYQSCDREITSILGSLMGGQEQPHNTHYSVFNQTYLAAKLREVGFLEIRPWDPAQVEDHDFEDWASRRLKRAGRLCEVSLNLEAVK
jgi:predicted SAM-dependent methyltransferase